MSPVSETAKVPPDKVYVVPASEPACGEVATSAPAASFTCNDQRPADAPPPYTCLITVSVGAAGGSGADAVFVSVHVFLSPAASVTLPDALQSPENAPV